MKDKKCITITSTFKFFFDKSGHKPNKTCVDQGSEFYNRSMMSWLHGNIIGMYSTHSKCQNPKDQNLQVIDCRIKICLIEQNI